MKEVSKEITILLVEDAAIMRKIEVKTLKAINFNTVIEAKDGKEAVECLKQNQKIDLVISDWNMPNMDGYELVMWMRSDENCKQIPFLMATGQGDKKQEQKAIDAGVSSFIAKPFNENELKRKINEAFGLVNETKSGDQKKNRVRQTADGKPILNIAHIQITDHIILGVLKHLIAKGELKPEHFELETSCMPGWNQVQEALETGDVDGAFILAPIAMDLFSYGTPIKLVLLAHKSGSICVRNDTDNYAQPFEDFFRNKSFLIPHKMSVHHMLAHLFFKRMGLKAAMGEEPGKDVSFEVVAPIKMQEFLHDNHDVSGFMVAEPLGTKAIATGDAQLQFLSGELWENHPCCVVTLRDDIIKAYPDAVYELVDMLVQAGQFVEAKPEKAAEIGVAFLDPQKKLGLKVPILKNVITEMKGINTSDLFPDTHSLKQMNDYMTQQMGIGNAIDMERFVDIRFADAACKNRISLSKPSLLKDNAEVVNDILMRSESVEETTSSSKAMLNLEGKYLTFQLGKQEFGVDIMRVKEIIGMLPIRSIPQSPDYIRGVVNSRGAVIPILDLKKRFGMGDMVENDRSCIVILEHDAEGCQFKVGVAVDAVSEVIVIKSSHIEAASVLGDLFDADHILAIAKLENRVKLLLDMDTILGQSDISRVAA